MDNHKLTDILDCIASYIQKEKYEGYDPYDGLKSPLFRLPVFNYNKLIRFGFQQVFRRNPINIRPLLFISKGLNPVSLGLSIQAYSYLYKRANSTEYLNKIDLCLDKLITLSSLGYSGNCWGYDFDWEASYAKIPAYVPTVVATGIITNALFVHYEITFNNKVSPLIISAADFVMKDLDKHFENNTFCYTYSPVDKRRVFNATMKGARLLAQAYSLTKEEKYIDEAFKTVDYVVKYQKPNGSWIYSNGETRKWADNHHTGYILDCLNEVINITSELKYKESLEKGLDYYIKNFFVEDTIPKFYDYKIYPIDTTSAAQSILTLTRFDYLERAEKVINWMIENMFNKLGYFYYQKNKYYIHKTSYMRWSNAWMFAAISYYLYKVQNNGKK